MAVKSSKVEQNPTLPFSDDEVERILVAARALTGFGRYGPKIEPMVLLLRYSGLRIQDAACLERARLVDDKLFLYQQKTGTPVYCPLPPLVVERLTAVKNDNEQFFFYDGTSQRAEHGQELGSRVSEGVRDGEAGDQRRTSASIPRHVRGLAPAQGRVDRDRVEAARTQFDQGDGTPLLAVGQGAAGAAGGRGTTNLAFGNLKPSLYSGLLNRCVPCQVPLMIWAATVVHLILHVDRLASRSSCDDLASGSTCRAVLLVCGEYTSRAPGFVPVAKVQLLIGTSAVVSSLVMASSVSRRGRFLESVLSNPHVKLRA